MSAAPCALGSTLLSSIDPIGFFILYPIMSVPAVHAEVKVRPGMTYSVSARVALTLAHTVTNMAGTPEGNTASKENQELLSDSNPKSMLLRASRQE